MSLTLAAALVVSAGPALAQSVWDGAGSSTATTDYNLGTNWSTNPVPPTQPGESAQFDATGSTTVTVTAGPITPDSWTFNATSQSYTVTGQAVNFGNAATLTNNASAGQAINIANNMSGTTLSQAAASTLTVAGTNSFTTTSVSAGTLVNSGSLTSSVGITGTGTFTNNLTVMGTVTNGGTSTFTNNVNGTVSGLVTNSGTGTNSGILNGALSNSGVFTNTGTVNNNLVNFGTYTQTAGSTNGGVNNNGGTINANGGAFTGPGAITNVGAATFNVGGTVTSDTSFNNSNAAARLLVNSGSFAVAGAVSNSGNNAAGGILVAAGATLSAGGITNNAAATIINNGTTDGAVSNAGTFTNNLILTGTISNSATFNNNANGTVSGLLTNTAGTATNAGQLNGGVAVSGGTVSNSNIVGGGVTVSGTGVYTQSAGTTSGGLTNGHTVNANGGAINGAIANNAGGTFNVGGAVTSNSTFNDSTASSLLAVSGTGNYTVTGALTNSGATASGGGITIASGGVLTAGGTTNNAGANFTDTGGTLNGGLTNAGSASNSGTMNGGLTNTAGTTTNTGQLNGGVAVSGGSVSNSNTVAGGVTVSGAGVYTQSAGTTSGGLTNSNTVNANGGAINGAIVNNTTGTFNVGGTVTSNSTFNNAASGTLAVGSAGNYTLQGLLTNGGTVTVASGGTLVDTAGGITNSAMGTITVAAGGTVHDDLNNAGIVTNGGTYVANVATNTGTITNNNIWNGNVLSNTGSIVNSAAATWTGNISTGGTFTNSGTITGTLTNTAGTTTNNGSISGAVTVSGGTFKGTGSAGGLTIGNGGVFAPGNGTPGTSATVNGSLAFSSGAFYQVAINPTTASFVNATGTATLGGASVQAFFSSGTYVSKQYTIVNATGGVIGTFNTLANTNLPSGFTSTLSYDATHAYLNLALNFTPTGPTAPAFNPLNTNQRNVANAVVNFFNTNGTVPVAFGALTPAGLTQVSGEIATASQQTTFDAMNLFMGVLTDPFLGGRGDSLPAGGGVTGYADADALAYAAKRKANDALAAIYTKAPPVTPFEARWSTWVAGYGGSQSTDGNAALGSNNTTSSVYGTAVGADYRFSPNTIAGFALAGGGTNFSVANSGAGHSDLFQAGAFIRHTEGAAYISGALAYGWQDVTTNRAVTVAGVDQLRAEFNANAYSGRIEGGYRFIAPYFGGFGLTPYAAGQFTTFDLPAYAESVLAGAGTFALNYNSKTVTDTRSELGLRTDKSYAMSDGILTLRGRAAWAHDYDPDRSIAATFQALPGASFVVNGAAQASDSALVTASVEKKWFNGWSAAATFEGEFSDVTRSYAGKGVVRYTW